MASQHHRTFECIRTLRGDDFALSLDGLILVTINCSSDNDQVKVWNLQTGELQRTLNLEEDTPHVELLFSPDGQTLVSKHYITQGNLHRSYIKLWNLPTGELRQTLEVGSVYVFSPDSRLLATNTEDGHLLFWDVLTGELQHTLKMPEAVWAIAFSPDGQILVSFHEDLSLQVWDFKSSKILYSLAIEAIAEEIFSLAISPDGQILACHGDVEQGVCDVSLWNLHTGEVLPGIWSGRYPILSFLADGTLVGVREYDHSISFWNVHTGEQEDCFSDDEGLEKAALSANGLLLATCGENYIKLWRVRFAP